MSFLLNYRDSIAGYAIGIGLIKIYSNGVRLFDKELGCVRQSFFVRLKGNIA
ncbi:hypothetical protein [Ammoniphilus sp. 3BR4]|uniref:hypothetical protein n=1 Tax=Ammoniphilus sp. 3BR4 TaxID=3158265 RepID=UPI003466F3F6